MTRAALVLAVVACGCANAYQSARTLPPGKTQVGVALSRSEAFGDEGSDTVWLGDLQVRTGIGSRMDGGVRLTRNPGGGENVSLLSLDPKWELSKPGARTAVSIGVPVGILWAEQGLDDLDTGAYIIAPSVFIGMQVSPTTELVTSPKLFFILPDEDGDNELEFGLSVGLRFTDAARTWAVHPEIGFLRVSEEGASEEFMMIGIAIAAGN